jgi:hypothetical protein
MNHKAKKEVILRQRRHWTRWIGPGQSVGEGNMVLTNRRLLFLHRINASPEVGALIRKLADEPIETVLNHALTLHKDCLQIPLKSIIRVGVGASAGFPFPRFWLTVHYYEKGGKRTPRAAAFQFKKPKYETFCPPQIIADRGWVAAIRREIGKGLD